MATAKELADNIQSQLNNTALSNIKASTDNIYNSLVVEQNRNKLPESIFVNHFLGYFSGEKPIAPNDKIFEEWISVAGTPMAEVGIVNEKGEVLYNVPALFDTNILDIARKQVSVSLPEIYSNYEARVNHIPVVGEKFLADALDHKVETILTESPVASENQQRWGDILKRYGKNPEVQQNINSKEDPADDLVYD